MDRDTVSIHFVHCALRRLNPKQCEQALQAARIAPTLLQSSSARVTAHAFSDLWRTTARLLDDEFFGLDPRRMKVGSFALLTQACAGASTLGQALRRLLRGLAVLLDAIQAELHVVDAPPGHQAVADTGQPAWTDGSIAEIRLLTGLSDPADRRFAEETLLILIQGLASWLVDQRLPWLQARFGFDAPPHAAEYRAMFCESLQFRAPRTALLLDARWLDAPVVHNPERLREFLRTAPQSVFVKYRNDQRTSTRIRRLLRACVRQPVMGQSELGQPDWPDMATVARQFGVSLATLRRQLLAEQTGFQAIKDEVRRDAAIHLLSESSLTVADIALRLGFQEVSAFRRAFKGWIGVQPGEYRSRMRAGTNSDTSPESAAPFP